jgi:hypothetical protein
VSREAGGDGEEVAGSLCPVFQNFISYSGNALSSLIVGSFALFSGYR